MEYETAGCCLIQQSIQHFFHFSQSFAFFRSISWHFLLLKRWFMKGTGQGCSIQVAPEEFTYVGFEISETNLLNLSIEIISEDKLANHHVLVQTYTTYITNLHIYWHVTA